jgi:hypothetical protein
MIVGCSSEIFRDPSLRVFQSTNTRLCRLILIAQSHEYITLPILSEALAETLNDAIVLVCVYLKYHVE